MGNLTVMREHLERVARALDEVMAHTAATGDLTPWQRVDWLRLHADLLDRLGAAAGTASPVSGRGELVRDRAERLADQLNHVPHTPRQPFDHLTATVDLRLVTSNPDD